MSSESGTRDYGRFDELAEEFAERFRRGERPSLQEYVDRLPEMAEEIREMFPALVEVERADGEVRGNLIPPPPPVAPHLSLIGDYRILREVGRGGMGVVYEAEQISLGRRVALKLLLGQALGDRKAQERFRREAKSAARLHHTNIVPVFEVGQEKDVCFYAMQLIQGQGLDQVIDELRRLREVGRKSNAIAPASPEDPEVPATASSPGMAATSGQRKRELARMAESILTGRHLTERLEPAGNEADLATGPIATERFQLEAASAREPGLMRLGPPPSAPVSASSSAVMPGGKHVSELDTSGRRQPFFRSVAQIGRQATQGLAHAHARGIVHRDIKPSNLLLDTDGVVWITDFGLAKADDDGLTASGDILGTLRYMAPERFRGEGDARADIYALGLTIYELLTLRPAYNSSDRLRLIEKVKNEEPDRPRSIDNRIPRDLETIVLKAIDKEPAKRYQTADALAEDLRRFLADEPIKARQISTSERYWRWARRNPAIATLGAVVTALLVAVTIGSLAAAAYFKDSAQRESKLASSEKDANQRSQADRIVAVEAQKDAVKAQRQALLERDKSLQLSAGLALGKGLALAEEGHADRGLLWMLEALKTAPEDAEEFRRMVRWNLGAWLGQVHKPLRIIDTGGPCNSMSFSPDGRSFATAFGASYQNYSLSRPIELWDTASGRKLASLPGAFPDFAFRPDGQVLIAKSDPWHLVAIDLATRQILWTTSQLPGFHWSGKIEFSADASTIFAQGVDERGNRLFAQIDAVTGRVRGEPIRSRGTGAVSPDGKTVATGRVDNGEAYIDLLDLSTGQRSSSWRAGGLEVLELLFSPDGKSLFGAQLKGGPLNQNSHFAQIWNTATGRLTHPFMRGAISANYVPSADRVVTVGARGDNLSVVRSAADGRVRGSDFMNGQADTTSWLRGSHPDGRTMLASSGHNVVLWQISPDAEPISDKDTDRLESMTGIVADSGVRDVTFLRDGLALDGHLAASTHKGAEGRESIRLSNPATARPLGRPASHNPGWVVRGLAFSSDGRFFATGSSPDGRLAGEVRLWDVNTGRLLVPPMPHTNYVVALAFDPDGKILAAGDYHGLVRFWETSSGREIGRPISQGEIVLSLAYSPDGKILAVGLSNDHSGKPGTRLWDTRTRQPIGGILPGTAPIRRIEFRPDSRALLADTINSTRLWDATRGQALSEPIPDERSGGFRPDGRAFLTSGKDGTVRLRDAVSGNVMSSLLTSSSPARCAAFHPDGRLVVAGFDDGSARLCDPATSQQVGPSRFMRHTVNTVVFTPDGRGVTAIDDFGESRSWPIPDPLPDEGLDDLTRRIEARTGLRMETGLAISRLDPRSWSDRLEQLRRLDPGALSLDDGPAWHEPMVREAEQSGNAFAAIWHLDRLIASHPDDWFHYARRARALSLSDKFDQAAADYQQAERLGSRDQVLDFQTHCMVDITKANRWAEALWYLDRLIAARPDDSSLHEARATVYGKLGREAERKAELARVIELGTDEGLAMTLAQELSRAGRWAEAARLLTRCGRRGSVSKELAEAWGVACLKAGDHAAYREACAAFMAWVGPNPAVVWDALSEASLLGLGSEGLDDYRVPIDWFGNRLASSPTMPPMYRRLFSNALGGLLLRAGRINEAIVRIDEGIAAAKDLNLPTDWALLAIAHARRGNFAEARRCLERIPALPVASSAEFWDIQEISILQSEAESLLFDAGFPTDPFLAPRPR